MTNSRWTWLAGALLVSTSCQRERATPELCGEILDRIVQLELLEQGFRDPRLTERKQATLRRQFGAELSACVGRPVASTARTCVQQAQSGEEISHRCLR